jgi:hypothetical protein
MEGRVVVSQLVKHEHFHTSMKRYFSRVGACGGRAGFYVLGFLSLNFLPLLRFISGSGDMKEGR